jgi:4-azaleucine resistance transporter AzlC
VTGPRAETGRRRLAVDAIGIAVSGGAFGVVYGLAARGAGFSLVEAMAMSILVLAGASQFAAVGMVAQGLPWAAIVLLTALVNARHLLYSAALAPFLGTRSRLERAVSAHLLTDETFALSLAYTRRIGRWDQGGYWIAAAMDVVPWIVATGIGYVAGDLAPDPGRLGFDVVFPAAMGGLAVLLIRVRRELVAAVAGGALGVVTAVAVDPAVGVVVGGLLAPLLGLAVRASPTPLPATDPAIGTVP